MANEHKEITAEPSDSIKSRSFLFADRFLSFAVGPSVTKLTLANEIGPNEFYEHTVLAMPTPQLIEAVLFLIATIKDDGVVRTGIIDGVKKFGEQIETRYQNIVAVTPKT